MDCGKQFMRILMFIFNFIFFALGLVLLGVGIYSRIKSKDYESVLGGDGTILSAANLLIAAGVLVTIIGFVGCCGAWKANKILLGIFAALIILIFIVEIAGGILAYTKKAQVEKHLLTGLKQIVSANYKYNPQTPEVKAAVKAMDFFQETVKCCGTMGANDWKDTPWQKASIANSTTPGKARLVPDSCCKEPGVKGSTCNEGVTVTGISLLTKINTQGCYKAGFAWIKDHMWHLGGAAIGVAVIQLFGIVFAICLIKAIREDEATA